MGGDSNPLIVLSGDKLTPLSDYPDPEFKRIAVYPEKTEELTGRYLKRLVDLIKGSPDISLLEEQGSARFQGRVAEPVKEYEGFAEGCKTAAQIEAVAVVKRVAKGTEGVRLF